MARRSSASARPARAAASSVRVVPSSAKAKRARAERGESLIGLSREEKRARRREAREQEDRVYAASNILLRENAEYARHRQTWYALIAAGVVMIVIAFILLIVLGEQVDNTGRFLQYAAVGMAYIIIIAAFIFDFVKIRPIRNAERTHAEGLSESRLNDVLERGARRASERRVRKKAKGSKEN
ncbi:hypothetical protein [Collinsella sp. zg1085]|uniref:hypothetical protein n=1 Tax=Collinsella sp. zg1085 TaxID=2844380 RepID=UPI00209A693C|nr:hypothetical protein [Collinsella sp. zg1085]